MGAAEPFLEFVGKSENDSAGAAGDAVDGQTAFKFPAADGAFVALKKGGDLLPGVEALVVVGLGRRKKAPFCGNVRLSPFLTVDVGCRGE